MSDFSFELISGGAAGARLGRVTTAHGVIDTPAFMPVGTYGAVKTVTPEEVRASGAQVILANTYHLHLLPGEALVRDLGGLHRFMNWDGPILTDSGGFQVFSLSALRRLTPEGVQFRSHLDGSSRFLSPESAVRIQQDLGSDVMMVLDECLQYPATREQAVASLELTQAWAARCKAAWSGRNALFGIVQGGAYPDLRRRAAEALREIDFSGYALGGFSVGEPPSLMYELVAATAPHLPVERPRYLMGVGTPADLVEAIDRGVDLFDCVLPTRNARNASLFTAAGTLNIRNAAHAADPRPVEPGCPCAACRAYSRAYLRHLALTRETLGLRLNTIHNLSYYQRLMAAAREAIAAGRWEAFRDGFRAAQVGSVGNESGKKERA
jgi:queuine tRNA-ribosyltransferase